MKRSALASRLIRERRSTERKKLLTAHRDLADARLARALKDHCYRVWTSDPADAQRSAAALRTLALFTSDKEIDALASWVEGVANITRGKLEVAVANLESASRSLRRLGNENESAQPLVAKLIALAMLGRYEAAQRTGEAALEIFRKYRDDLAAGKIEMNLSNIVSRRDQYRLAERYCLSAYRRFKKLGETSWQTMAENGLANTYAELNDFKRAEEFYERALSNARRARMNVTVAEIEASMGNLALFRGMYAEAIRRLELSRQKYERLRMPHQSAIADLEIADIYAELNLNAEATDLYRRLIPLLHRLKLRAEEARARANLGRVLVASGDSRNARAELRRAERLFELEKNEVGCANVQLRLASLELKAGQYNAALALARKALKISEKNDNIRLQLSAAWLEGDILTTLERDTAAKKLLKQTLQRSRRAEQPAIVQATLNSLGVLARNTGHANDAEALFMAAIESIEAARDPLPGEEFRMAFLAKSLAPFENLSRLHIDRGDIEKAFLAVERARSRSLFEAVAARRSNKTNAASDKLREELNWLYSRLSRADAGETAKLQKQVLHREKKLATQLLRRRGTAQRRMQTQAGGLDLRAIQDRLGRTHAMIEYVEHEGIYSAFVITDDHIEYVANLATRAETRSLLDGLHFQFGALRFGESMRAFAGQLKDRADVYLKDLHDKLLTRLRANLDDRDLVIVPTGALNYVPFHALHNGDRYEIESHEITYAPSAAVWLELRERREQQIRKCLLMSFADEKIPLVDNEVRSLAKLVPHATKFSGRSATFSAFQQNAPDADLIHLACHGQFRPDNPMFSSLRLADGWVTVRDVCDSRLKARLVTLSACETGRSDIYAGDEILGLARGFLSAGARALVLSLWTVNDAATSQLMLDFYDGLQLGRSIAASLRGAQVELIKRGEHPYFWSPFFAIA